MRKKEDMVQKKGPESDTDSIPRTEHVTLDDGCYPLVSFYCSVNCYNS